MNVSITIDCMYLQIFILFLQYYTTIIVYLILQGIHIVTRKLDLHFAAIWMLKKTFHIKDRIQHQSLRTWKNTFLREKYDTNYVTTAK